MQKDEMMLSLGNLGRGAAIEKFQDSLEKVIENICNPNTKPDAKRSINLVVTFKPGKNDRSRCAVTVNAKETLAPVVEFETIVDVGMEHGVPVASEYSPQQKGIFDNQLAGSAGVQTTDNRQ